MEEELAGLGRAELEQWMQKAAAVFVEESCGGDKKLLEYLAGSITDHAVRMKEAAGSGALGRIIL